MSYRFRLDRIFFTTENTEDTEGESREMNNLEARGFDINNLIFPKPGIMKSS